MGVELENQGGDEGDYFVQRRKLAAGAHWEHRVLGVIMLACDYQ